VQFSKVTPQIGQPLGIGVLGASYEKSQFSPVHIAVSNGDDLHIGVLDLLFSEFLIDDYQFSIAGDNHDNVPSILSEDFAKILLLSNNFASIYADLHSVILMQLLRLYFSGGY
jgi:condensin complex subunit 3